MPPVILETILDAVGNTPLVRLSRVGPASARRLSPKSSF